LFSTDSPSSTSIHHGKTHTCANGVQLHYRIQGDGPTTLLFLHGFAASSVTWEELRPYFPPDRYRLYLLDLKGAGLSAKPRDGAYRPEDHAALVLDFMEGLQLHDVVLAGHSLGGGIALFAGEMARESGRERLIGRLVLIDAAAYPQRLPRFFAYLRMPVAGSLILHLLPLKVMVRYNLEHVYHAPGQVTEERIKRYSGCFTGRNTAYALIATARQLDPAAYQHRLPDYGKISIPTLIVWGRHDRVIRLPAGERLHREIPGSRLAILDAGHNPHEERAEACAAAISAFMEEHG